MAALVASLTLLTPSALTEAQTTGTGITMKIVAASAPNSASAVASWNSWQINAVHALRNGLLTRGDRQADPTAYYQALDLFFVAQDLMVTTGDSWRGEANPAAPYDEQHGNRVHFGLHAYGDGAVQFRLRDVEPFILSAGADETLNAQFVLSTRTLGCYRRHGWNWGPDRTKGTADDVKICESTHPSSRDEWLDEFVYSGFGNGYWPDRYLSSADQADKQKLQQAINQTIDIIDSELKWFTGRVAIRGNNGVTYRAHKTILNQRLRQSSESAGSKYDWCFNQRSGQACAAAIGRWEAEAEKIALPGSGHCPATHAIRVDKSDGSIECRQTYHPFNPQPLAEAWGVVGGVPEAVQDDTWDGSTPRSCSSHTWGGGYFTIDLRQTHGLRYGCHTHPGSGFHEHAVGKHCTTASTRDHWTDC